MNKVSLFTLITKLYIIMKKLLFKNAILTVVLFLSITFYAQSQNEAINESNQEFDKGKILEECLDIANFQKYLAKDTTGSFLPIHIMQYPVVFSKNINLSKFDAPIVFNSRHEISTNNVKSFFIFKILTIDGDTSLVEFDYYNNSNEEQLIEVTANLKKSDSDWEITNSTLNIK